MTSTSGLSGQIQKLLAEKQLHTDALSRIDATLEKVSALLGMNMQVAVRRGRGRPPKVLSTPKAFVIATPPLKGKRRWFSVTAEQSILEFVSRNANSTTKDVNRHWKAEGRGGTADNTLSLMVKKRAIKRVPIAGKKGSTYMVV